MRCGWVHLPHTTPFHRRGNCQIYPVYMQRVQRKEVIDKERQIHLRDLASLTRVTSTVSVCVGVSRQMCLAKFESKFRLLEVPVDICPNPYLFWLSHV